MSRGSSVRLRITAEAYRKVLYNRRAVVATLVPFIIVPVVLWFAQGTSSETFTYARLFMMATRFSSQLFWFIAIAAVAVVSRLFVSERMRRTNHLLLTNPVSTMELFAVRYLFAILSVAGVFALYFSAVFARIWGWFGNNLVEAVPVVYTIPSILVTSLLLAIPFVTIVAALLSLPRSPVASYLISFSVVLLWTLVTGVGDVSENEMFPMGFDGFFRNLILTVANIGQSSENITIHYLGYFFEPGVLQTQLSLFLILTAISFILLVVRYHFYRTDP